MKSHRPLSDYFNPLTAWVGDHVRVTSGPLEGQCGEVWNIHRMGPLPVVVSFRDGSYVSFEYSQLEWDPKD